MLKLNSYRKPQLEYFTLSIVISKSGSTGGSMVPGPAQEDI